jgi:hypothetical protein
MSSFKKLIQDHAAAKAATLEAQKTKDLEAIEVQRRFSQEFSSLVASVAKPKFLQFATDLRESGFQAQVEEQPDDEGRQGIQVRFTCDPVSVLNASTRECMYRLSCDHVARKVWHSVRIGRDAEPSAQTYGLQSINENVLDRELMAVLAKGLKQFGSGS